MKGHLTMSVKERDRKTILDQYKSGYFGQKEAAILLKLSIRQLKRIVKRYNERGDVGLIHLSRGRVSNRKIDLEKRNKILSVYRERLEGFGPTFACEKLEAMGFKVSHDTLGKWLKEEGVTHKTRKRSKHRSRRERRASFGELVQIDGSIHRWFSDERYSCLINMVDDATGRTLSMIFEGETTKGVLETLRKWIQNYGVPKAVYVDLKNVYVGLLDEYGQINSSGQCVFADVCENLGIQIIKAYSPQAKGRVERNHGVYQDRLVKEIILNNLKTHDQVNAFLENEFIPDINKRFAKQPASSKDSHRPSASYNLDDIMCWKYSRVVQNDHTIRYKNKFYQILSRGAVRVKQKVVLKEHLDETLSMHYRGMKLDFKEILEPSKDKTPECRDEEESSKVSTPLKEGKSKSPWHKFNPGFIGRRKPA